MAMRYIVRRSNSEELSDIKSKINDLMEKLGAPDVNMQRTVDLVLNGNKSLHYSFFARKTVTGFIWVCPSIELVSENESGLFELTDFLKVPRPSHLTAL